MRDEMGWHGGEDVEIEVVDGSVVISPVETKITLIETDDGIVAVPEVELPALTAFDVAAARRSVNR